MGCLMRRTLIAFLAALGMAPTVVLPAAAQGDYPNKPVRILVAYAPGGSADIMARLLAPPLGRVLGTTIVVDNKPGGGGIVGSEACARAPADGYTICFGSTTTHSILPFLHGGKLPFDPLKDFTALTLVGTQPNVIAVNPKVPATTLAELVAWARKTPGVGYATAGIGTSNHLIGAYLNKELGLDIAHVPYRSGGLATGAAVAGEVPMVIDQISTVLPFLNGEKLRAIAVTSPKRSQLLPDVPSITEGFLPSIKFDSYQAVFAPAGVPPQIVHKLNDAIRTALADPEIRKRHLELGIELVLNSSEDFTAWLRETAPRWQELVALSGAKVE
ncbi:tripartite tricarboxylate transporter substrate binding protein [Reyranella sp. CPCC 100927]|nr:tripartite tricarboxylate transporter substrate binding protein [Reyranella sp. CPCC 100927]